MDHLIFLEEILNGSNFNESIFNKSINQILTKEAIIKKSIDRKLINKKSIITELVINQAVNQSIKTQFNPILNQFICKHQLYSNQRYLSTLTHIKSDGNVQMVNVSDKSITTRIAKARAIVIVGPEVLALIKSNSIKKGAVLTCAEIAGITAAKRTSSLIPMCHNINLNHVEVVAETDDKTNSVIVNAKVTCEGKTGVEMEALTAVSVAALTVYDMCKSVNKAMTISNIELLEKSGGKSDFNRSITVKDYDKTPLDGRNQVVIGGV